MKHLPLILLALLLLAGIAAAGPLEDGKAAFLHGDYPTALRLLRPLAANGDAEAADTVGVIYHNGWSVKQDDATALTWWRKAANAGNVKAEYSLGLMYKGGNAGLPKDDATAVKWFLKSAAQGSWQAQFQLGAMYAGGQGVRRDDVEAFKWYKLEMQHGLDDTHLLQGLAAKMSQSQLAEANRRASEWRPSPGR